jgi:hypothetical protein
MNDINLEKLQSIIEKSLTEVLEERGKLISEGNKLTEKEVSMIRFQLFTIIAQAKEVHDLIGDYPYAPAWAEAKINTAYNMISKIRTYMVNKVEQEKSEVTRAVGDTDPTNFPKKKITKE